MKILDARQDLSIQVHPPANLAKALGGEPKTEMWFISDCDKGATLYVGLKNGVTREAFEQAIHNGTVADCVHAIHPSPGDSILIPSGRLHAIGGGFLIHEIQQNSDTTYRVFDWNRLGIDGKPRALHIEKSLASIDFHDYEPTMDSPNGNLLAECPYFRTEKIVLNADQIIENPDPNRFSILCIIDGELTSPGRRIFRKGQSILQPRSAKPLKASRHSTVLQITLPIDGCPS
jgi:mannose-6-phosphate isomerase